MKEWLPTILCCVMAVVLFTQRRGEGKGGDVDSVIVTRVDTVMGSVTINNWNPKIIVPGNVPVNVDTAAILRDYFVTNQYDTAFKDSVISGTVSLSVSENKVSKFNLKYQALNKTTTITLREFKPALYVGGFVSTKNDFGASLIYADQTRAYMGGYNFSDKSIQVGLTIKIK